MRDLFLVIFVLVLFVACSKDDNDSKETSCLGITDLEVYSYQHEYYVDWKDSDSVAGDRYEIEYGFSGFNIGNGVKHTVEETEYYITELEYETVYDVYVSKICKAGGKSTPTKKSFTTEAYVACMAPYELDGYVDYTTVYFYWNHQYEQSAWEVQYGLYGFTLGTGTVISTSTNGVTIEGLQSQTSYEFYVRANCGSTIGYSEYSGPLVLVTD